VLVAEGTLVEPDLEVEKPEAVGRVAVALGVPEGELEPEADPLALALARKASKDFSAVGLIAKTIPA